jgi:hypothetical protein
MEIPNNPANQSGTDIAYPKADIPPSEKNEEWAKLYAKAAWNDWQYSVPRTCFWNAADKYEELRLYATGKQPINQYKKWFNVDEATDDTFLNLDWNVRPVVAKYRDLAISRLVQTEYNIVATPIDPEARAELSGIYADMTAKIAMQAAMNNPELQNHPILKKQPGEPLDSEELAMRVGFGEQFNRSKDAEQAIMLALYENRIKEIRRKWYESLFDCGVAGFYEWLDRQTKRPKCREVNVEAVITSMTRFADFHDLEYAGEITDVPVTYLATVTDKDGNKKFTEDQLEYMRNDVAGKWTTASMIGRSTNYFKGFDKWKVKVLELEFFSWNDYYYNMWVNGKGNLEFEWKNSAQSPQGKRKYKGKRIKVVYRVKWIVGTDLAYDFELAEDMKRSNDPKKKAETKLGYTFYAPNFYEMRTLSMMERLKPLADEYQMLCMRIQNMNARMIPDGFWIDLDALESAALKKGGKDMEPMQLLQMFYDTGILVGRTHDLMNNNVNFKPVLPLANDNSQKLTVMYQGLISIIQQMEGLIGFNDATAGATINPKTLNGAVQQMDQTTNNALFPLQFAEKFLFESLSNDMLIRMQQAVKRGPVSGYAPALGSNTLKFMEISPAIGAREYGILLEERTTDDQKQILMQQMGIDQQNQLIDSSDVLYIMNTYNVKQAQEMLAYKVKKNKQAMMEAEQAKGAQQSQGQMQVQQQASMLRMQELDHEYSLKMKLADVVGAWQEKTAAAGHNAKLIQTDMQITGDIIQKSMDGALAANTGAPPGQPPGSSGGQPGPVQPNPGPASQGAGQSQPSGQ